MLLTAFIDLLVPQGCKDIFNVTVILKSCIESDREKTAVIKSGSVSNKLLYRITCKGSSYVLVRQVKREPISSEICSWKNYIVETLNMLTKSQQTAPYKLQN